MISLASETLVALRDAPKHLPTRPNGKRLHVSAVYRWITKGVKGVVLEAIRIGGTTYTSVEALQRFAGRLSGKAAVPAAMPAMLPRVKDADRLLAVRLCLPPGSTT